jgi:hypothetical protein
LRIDLRWAVLGFSITLVGVLVALFFWFRNPAPRLTRAAFDEARQRWERSQTADYDVEIEVKGRQPAVYRVEVRNNRVQRALRNGYPLKQRRTHGTWSVPGMFGTIETDLESAEGAREKAPGQDNGTLLLRAVFDPKLGYPSYYHRHYRDRYVSDDVVWRVRRFVARPRRAEAQQSLRSLPCSLAPRIALRPWRPRPWRPFPAHGVLP